MTNCRKLSFHYHQIPTISVSLTDPCQEIMVLFVLRQLNLQTRMRSHPLELDVWFLIGPFLYFHTSCMRTVKALGRLRRCVGLPEPSLVAYVISTIISWAGSIVCEFSTYSSPSVLFPEKKKNQYHLFEKTKQNSKQSFNNIFVLIPVKI